MKTIIIALLFGITGFANAVEVSSPFSVYEPALAYSKNFDYHLGQDGMNRVSAVVTYTSAAPSAITFTDGRTSSGTITVVSTTALRGTIIKVSGTYFQFGPSTDMNTSIYNPVAVGADVTASAHNLATAIDAKLAGTISASHTLGVIDLVSDKADGVAYPVTTSKPAVVSVGGATMGLGVAQTVSNATDLITKASHGFTVGLPVLYTGGTGTPSPLVTGTTYYALPATANTLYLSSTSALAQAGSYIGLSGIADGATAHTFTLTPLNITGVPGLKWKASNDGSAWVDLSVSSITMSAYTLGGTTTAWDFEWFNFRWLRMFVDGPTTGGIYIKSDVNVKK